ncbi:hypothetical protein BU17DRAFT_71451 [Hysterangium stoloniferum]|nr:hypothetical protein BU17DRAFT_71451 [Hysterangium stoloniferum]
MSGPNTPSKPPGTSWRAYEICYARELFRRLGLMKILIRLAELMERKGQQRPANTRANPIDSMRVDRCALLAHYLLFEQCFALGIPPSGKKRWIVIAWERCPDKSGIDSWHRDVCNYVVSAEYDHIINNSRALELRRMKERDTSAVHEYFIAKIQHADGCTRYLRIERFPEDYIPTTTRQHSASRVSLSMDSLKERAAPDEVSTVSGWPRHDRVLP